MSKVDRSAVTEMLSMQLERQILSRYPIWAREVKLDDYHWMYSADRHKGRVDYMAFEPLDMSRSIRSLEAGTLHVFEVKSCMADLKSGHGMNKVGDVNWLVCTKELWTEICQKQVDTSGWLPLVYGWIREGRFNPCPLRYERTDIVGRKLPLVQAIWMMYATNHEGRHDGYRSYRTQDQEQACDELRRLVSELLPYAADSCPDECRYRKECDSDSNLGTDGFPLLCVAYGHLLEKARVLGVDVSSAAIERIGGAQADAQRPTRTGDAPASGNAQLEDGAEQALALPIGK